MRCSSDAFFKSNRSFHVHGENRAMCAGKYMRIHLIILARDPQGVNFLKKRKDDSFLSNIIETFSKGLEIPRKCLACLVKKRITSTKKDGGFVRATLRLR